MADKDLPVGAEIRTAAGNIFVKVAPGEWMVRVEWGALDHWTTYSDNEVHGEIIKP